MGDVDQTCSACGKDFDGPVGNGKCPACNEK